METCCEFIHVKKNGVDGTSYPLTCGTEMILGSDKNCDFRIQLPSVSEKHVKINIDNNGKVFISNIGDSNSMELNNKLLTKTSFVPHNSIINVGSLKFRFHYSSALADQMNIDQKSPATHKSPRRQNKENIDSNIPATPNSELKKRKLSSEKVPTPIPAKRSRRSSNTRLSTLSISLMSIPESSEPTPSPRSIDIPQIRAIVSEMDFITTRSGRHTRKSVSFGPVLSPEFFDRRMPPNTPVKRGSLPFGIMGLQSLAETPNEFHSDEDNDTDSTYDSIPDEDTETAEALPELKKAKMSLLTPLKVEIGSKPVLRSTKRALPTPIRHSIRAHPGLTRMKKSLPTPLRTEIKSKPALRKTLKSLSTPIKAEIKSKPSLRKTKQSLPTPLKMEIRAKPTLKNTNKSLPTPVTKEIQTRPGLRKTLKSLPTPLRTEIRAKPSLRKTKRTMSTPLRNEIRSKPSLRKTLKSLPTPLRTEIRAKPSLRKSKRTMSTPLRNEIRSKPSLRKTLKSLPTPLRTEIRAKPSLRKTKRTMSTPLRNEIRSKPSLRKTLKSLPTPLRTEIRAKPSLRKTKRTMSTPLRNEIRSKPSLRKTLKSLPTPLRTQIKSKPNLRKTKQTLPTPIREAIRAKPSLNKTKKSLPTPVKDAICSKPSLRKTKQSLPTPVRLAIVSKPQLRKTKQSLPTPLRTEIEGERKLRVTKRSLPSPLKAAIEAKHILRKTKKAIPSDLRDQIKMGFALRKTKKLLATPLREEIKSRPNLRKTKQSLPTPLREEIQGCPNLKTTKHSLATPVRQEIESCPLLRTLKKSLPTPLRNDIKSKPTLKNIPKKKEVCQSRKRNRSDDPSTPIVTTEPARKKQRVNPATPIAATVLRKNVIENIPSYSPTIDATALKNMFSVSNTDNGTDPTDYFEPFLFEAQEVVETMEVKPKRSRVVRKNLANTVPMRVRRSSRLRQPTTTTTALQEATVSAKRLTRNNAEKTTKSNVVKSKSRALNSEMPKEVLSTSNNTSNVELVNTKSDCVPIERTVRATRSHKHVITSSEVTAGSAKTTRTQSKVIEKADTTTTELPPKTRTRSCNKTIQQTQEVSNPKKRSTRSTKKSENIESISQEKIAVSEEPTDKHVITDTITFDTVKPVEQTRLKSRRTRNKATDTPATEILEPSQPTSTRRSTRSQKSDSMVVIEESCDVSPPVSTAEKKTSFSKSNKKERHVKFASHPEVNPITPHVVRRSARLKK